MSSAALVQGQDGVGAAWETDGQIYFCTIKPGTTEHGKPQPAPGSGGGRKHPALAVDDRGDTLLVWTEGTGWQKGGALAWQVFDKSGRCTEENGRVEQGVPVWGLPTAASTAEGFVILH